MPKKLIFVDTAAVETTVDFTSDLDHHLIKGAEVIHWNLEGVDQAIDGNGFPTQNFYIQVQFGGSLENRTIVAGARPDMVQLPLVSFGGWGISPHPIRINLRTQPWSHRFTVKLYGMGESPSVLVPATGSTFRAVLWIEVEYE